MTMSEETKGRPSMAVIPGTFLPSDDDGSGVARETEEERRARIARETRAATVMASDPGADVAHTPGGTEGVEKAIS